MESTIVVTTESRCAIIVESGAATMAATPAMAEFKPIMEEDTPRFSRMIESSGNPRPMAIPTAVIAETAAIRAGQWISSRITGMRRDELSIWGRLNQFANESSVAGVVERNRFAKW